MTSVSLTRLFVLLLTIPLLLVMTWWTMKVYFTARRQQKGLIWLWAISAITSGIIIPLFIVMCLLPWVFYHLEKELAGSFLLFWAIPTLAICWANAAKYGRK